MSKEEVHKQIMAKARLKLETAAIVVENQAKKLCPIKTSNLVNSIEHKTGETVAIIGSAVEYAPHVEYGTRFQAAQSFLRAGLDQSKNAIRKFFNA